MPTIEEAKRMWEGHRVQGSLDTMLLPMRLHYQALRLKLDDYLGKRLLTNQQWPQMQYLQGQLKAARDLILQIEQLSRPGVEEQPRARPTQSD